MRLNIKALIVVMNSEIELWVGIILAISPRTVVCAIKECDWSTFVSW